MIKIIKEGNNPDDKPKVAKCHKCKTIFSYQNEDIVGDFRDGDFVQCPKCKAAISTK